ncbi:hypothetical protein CEXT_655251 [Caerostris extrusa]|uniref:Uncharacterized protein n=1 Tax=Caerostris extrusa TaxID=172846 RepID=A0AAV4X901_CAEEX|nr:hypothetical protein CEXT_655251 [Caerostris extrusa]
MDACWQWQKSPSNVFSFTFQAKRAAAETEREVNNEILSCQKLIHQHRESIARLEDRVAQLSEEQSHPQ